MRGLDEAMSSWVGAGPAAGLLPVNPLQRVKEPAPVPPLSSPVPRSTAAGLWVGTGSKGHDFAVGSRTNEQGGPNLYFYLFAVSNLQKGCGRAWSNRNSHGW